MLQVAGQSIDCGLAQGAALEPAVEDYPLQLQAVRATFVTLKAAGALRGSQLRLLSAEPATARGT